MLCFQCDPPRKDANDDTLSQSFTTDLDASHRDIPGLHLNDEGKMLK